MTGRERFQGTANAVIGVDAWLASVEEGGLRYLYLDVRDQRVRWGICRMGITAVVQTV